MTREVLEAVAHLAPVGIRLRDAVTGDIVSDGVTVRIFPPAPARATETFRTASGIFGARGLPGLRRWEVRDAGPDGVPAEVLVAPLRVRIEVRDRSGFYHSFAVGADLPSDGILDNPCGVPASPPEFESARHLPMFSRPGRRVPAGLAVVRARLLHEADLRPAAFAALDVIPRPGADPVRGIADERGEVVVMFPYPPPQGLSGSPPDGTKRPLASATWTVALRAHLPRVSSPPEGGDLPNLCSFLDQSPATLVTTTSPPAMLGEATVQYGRELVLRSSPLDAALLVRP
jgi:hypothetical protein